MNQPESNEVKASLAHTHQHLTPEEGLRRFLLSVEQAKGGPPPKMVPISPRPMR
jgi:hypothetical protein